MIPYLNFNYILKSKSSILAVLHSVQTNDIYFVADGSGKHIFASSYKQHLQNIEKIRSK